MKKYFWGFILLLLIFRAVTPQFILRQTNQFLATFSETYTGHIDDFDISLLRGAYQMEGFSLHLKQHPTEEFVIVDVVDVSLAWRELFAGKIKTDIEIDRAKLVITNKIMNAFSNAPEKSKDESQAAAKKLFPVRVGRIDIKDSSFEFADLLSIPEANRWRITKIEGRLSNVTGTENAPVSLLSLRGDLFNSSTLKIVSLLNLFKKPVVWDADLELRDFNIPNANGWLKNKVPITFTSGTLDLYSEVRSNRNSIEGYVKPFLHKVDVVANPEVFSGFKQFAIEVSAATANLILRSAKEKLLATKVLFSYRNGDFKVNSSKAISEAFKNGFSEKIPEGIDDEISLSRDDMTITKTEDEK
jgi:hypothetical protein